MWVDWLSNYLNPCKRVHSLNCPDLHKRNDAIIFFEIAGRRLASLAVDHYIEIGIGFLTDGLRRPNRYAFQGDAVMVARCAEVAGLQIICN